MTSGKYFRMLYHIYEVGVLSTGGIIFVGNAFHGTLMAWRVDFNERHLELWENLSISALKSICYSSVWFIFLPYTFYKYNFNPKKMVARSIDSAPYRQINVNGFLPHFIPGSFANGIYKPKNND